MQEYYLTLENIDNFMIYLRTLGRKKKTLVTYENSLKLFYKFLPEDKKLTPTIISQWQQSMLDAGLSVGTINTRTSGANSYMTYIEKQSWCATFLTGKRSSNYKDVSREDYIKLLQTARKLKNLDAYMIIKVLCCTGINPQEMYYLTVSRVETTGLIQIIGDAVKRSHIHLPEFLRQDLLMYAKEKGIEVGPIFCNKDGHPYSTYDELSKIIKPVADIAGIPEVKSNARSLRRLYRSLYDEIYHDIFRAASEQYDN